MYSSSPLGKDSDQLLIKIISENPKVARKYLNGLLSAFDNDGISDRQLEYKRTIEFVNDREKILKKELEVIETKKQKFKQINNLSDLSVDAGNNISLNSNYNTELFNAESQKSLANFLLESMSNSEYDYLPLNIGLEKFDINQVIIEYNNKISERNRLLVEAGPNNVIMMTLESQLNNLNQNISNSLINYINSVDLKIVKIREKEVEFENVYNSVPENEKTLRSIDRELSIKEALYLLLLQKREEAAINLAVVRPTIKVIDYPITSNVPISPKSNLIYVLSIALALFLYVVILLLWFSFDNKIHHKEQLQKKLNKNIPVICEIPFISDKESLTTNNSTGNRSVLTESIRMLISNLKYNIRNYDDDKCRSVIFTSSIKGEGKTLASVNTAINISNDTKNRVLLIGTDLRNPQIHKIFGVEKDIKGITDILYQNKIEKYKDYVNRFGNLDVIFSGAIPPNPTALLSSDLFRELFLLLKKDYDYIIVDSAPCLLVSDTFQIVDYIDSVVYMFRANFTERKIVDYINEIYDTDKFKNLNVVLNAVGNSSSYGYKYGYQYGYKYGYKYGYNYGYGYGYSENT